MQAYSHQGCAKASTNASLRSGLEAASLVAVISNSLPDLKQKTTASKIQIKHSSFSTHRPMLKTTKDSIKRNSL